MKTINLLNGLPLPLSSRRTTFFPVIGATARVRRRDFPALGEVISLWFAMLSPLIGLIIGFLGAWFVAWLTS